MKRIQIFLAFFLMLFVFSCQNVQEGISPVEKTTTGNQRVAACIPSNFYPAITTSSDLFNYRYSVALYRYYVKIYGDYASRKFVAEGKRPIPVVDITVSTINGLGLSEVSSLINDISTPIKVQYIDKSKAWDNVIAFIAAGDGLPTSTKQAIVNKANAWDGTGTDGSYTIIFQNPDPLKNQKIYSGKGGGQTRCEISANSRCPQIPLRADFQSAAVDFSTTTTREAFKEEAIRMRRDGFGTFNDLSVNVIQSPGYGYILSDGY
jgi:hypothetical protein